MLADIILKEEAQPARLCDSGGKDMNGRPANRQGKLSEANICLCGRYVVHGSRYLSGAEHIKK
jgi:hypothetical protein